MRREAAPKGVIGARPAEPDTDHCELCLRQAPRYTVHHLVPRTRGGKHGPKAKLCPTCYRQLHAMFTEATLAQEIYSIALLRSNPEVDQYLRWVRRQQGATSFRVRQSSVRQ